jgi:hypothetical protein
MTDFYLSILKRCRIRETIMHCHAGIMHPSSTQMRRLTGSQTRESGHGICRAAGGPRWASVPKKSLKRTCTPSFPAGEKETWQMTSATSA